MAATRNTTTTVKHNGRTTEATVEPEELLDLDALETDENLEPYRFRLAGREWEMAHPNALDWHVTILLEQGRMSELMPELLGDQYAEFDQIRIPAWKLDRLFLGWGKHIGIPLEKLQASSTSSDGTGGRSRRTSVTTTASGSST